MALTVVKEKSTIFFQVDFQDENGAEVIPTAASWSLTDTNGNVVNSRDQVAINPLLTTVNIPLTGDDLAVSNQFASNERIFLVEATYDTASESDLTLKETSSFLVEDLVKIT